MPAFGFLAGIVGHAMGPKCTVSDDVSGSVMSGDMARRHHGGRSHRCAPSRARLSRGDRARLDRCCVLHGVRARVFGRAGGRRIAGTICPLGPTPNHGYLEPGFSCRRRSRRGVRGASATRFLECVRDVADVVVEAASGEQRAASRHRSASDDVAGRFERVIRRRLSLPRSGLPVAASVGASVRQTCPRRTPPDQPARAASGSR